MKKLIKKIINITFYVLTVSTLLVGSYFIKIWFDETEMFELKKIIVKNEYLISKGDILDLSTLKLGTRVFDLDLNEIERKIADSKYVNIATVKILYPATIVISVEEENPIAFYLTKNKLKLVDDQGTIMGVVNPEKSLDLPIISDKKINDDIIKLLNESKTVSAFVYHKISEISYKKKIGIILSLTDNSTKVIIGKGDFDKKVLVLENFLRDMNKKIEFNKTQYIDLRFENQVVVKEDISTNQIDVQHNKI